jgi:acetyl esterase
MSTSGGMTQRVVSLILPSVVQFRPRPGAFLRRAFDRAVHRAAAIGYALHPAANPRRHGITVTHDLAYRETGRRSHRLDVYRPTGPGLRPAVLYVHGGAFSMLSKDTHRVMALALASRGYVVFNVNYRLGPKHRYPAPLEDVAAALLWVLDHAAEHGADASRLVLAGESAGANLVTALAYASTHPRPEPFAHALFERRPALRAVLAIYGMHDVVDPARLWRAPHRARKWPIWIKRELAEAARAYVGRPAGDLDARAPLASPLRRICEPPSDGARPLPAFFLAVGTRDPLLDDSRRLRAALQTRGVTCDLRIYPGEIHGFNAMIWRRAAQEKWNAVYAFLAEHTR